MPEDDESPEDEPRYLLPDGCKDLIDALRLNYPEEEVEEGQAEPVPTTVAIPDPVAVRELASRLHVKGYMILKTLMDDANIFATLLTELDFATASRVCSRFGVAANKII